MFRASMTSSRSTGVCSNSISLSLQLVFFELLCETRVIHEIFSRRLLSEFCTPDFDFVHRTQSHQAFLYMRVFPKFCGNDYSSLCVRINNLGVSEEVSYERSEFSVWLRKGWDLFCDLLILLHRVDIQTLIVTFRYHALTTEIIPELCRDDHPVFAVYWVFINSMKHREGQLSQNSIS